jgi:hypothetical protein
MPVIFSVYCGTDDAELIGIGSLGDSKAKRLLPKGRY